LGEAIRYIKNLGLENIRQYEEHLLHYATEKLLQIAGMQIIGTAAQKSSVISFLVGGIHPYDMGMLLDRLGIAVRTGHHCAQPLMDALGIEGTLRASFAFYNTEKEIDTLIEGIERVAKMF
jgi:cysteine desulfurase/selenocysteine lyase